MEETSAAQNQAQSPSHRHESSTDAGQTEPPRHSEERKHEDSSMVSTEQSHDSAIPVSAQKGERRDLPGASLNNLQDSTLHPQQQSPERDLQQNQRPQTDTQTSAAQEPPDPSALAQQRHGGVKEDEFNDEDLEDDDRMQNDKNYVVEISPKGRFKRFGEELGRGAYKIVYKGVDNETGREIAWNEINLNRLPKQDKVRIKSEIDLIKKLQHKNIIHFISAWYNKEKDSVVFITEMITGGSLRKYVKRIKTPRLKVVKGWCREILQGLVYLHDQKPHPIIHRDLKCDNIFINSNSGDIRIGDLGLSTPMHKSFTTSVLGTPEFMAPELYQECYGTGVDIYAFGMCVLEMLTLERPYKECNNPAQIYYKVVNGIYPKALERIQDEEVKNFILLCLGKADQRPSAKELLESPFLNETESEKNNQEVAITRSQSIDRKKAGAGTVSTKTALETAIAAQAAVAAKEQLLVRQANAIQEEDDEQSGDSKTNLRKGRGGETQNGGSLTAVSPVKDQNNITQAKTEASTVFDPASSSIASQVLGQVSSQEPDGTVGQSPYQVAPVLHEESKASEPLSQASAVQQPIEVKQASQSSTQLDTDLTKKKQKQEAKTQLLDESVSFLQKIDEDKQKRLQELSILPPPIHEEDDKCCIGQNILDDLKHQDMLDEQKRHLAESHHQPGQSLTLVKAPGVEKAEKKVNYDSSDAQLQPKRDLLGQPAQPSKDEGGAAKKFGLEKKFKEDHVSNSNQLMKTGVAPLGSKQASQQKGQPTLAQPTKAKNGSQADLPKQSMIQGDDQKGKAQQESKPSSQPSQFAKKPQQPSEPIKNLSPSTSLQPAKQGGQGPQASAQGAQEQVFDVQNSSSSESSSEDQDQDSEVDKIQIPRNQAHTQAKNESGLQKTISQVKQTQAAQPAKPSMNQVTQQATKPAAQPKPAEVPNQQSAQSKQGPPVKKDDKAPQAAPLTQTSSKGKDPPSATVEVAECKNTQFKLLYKLDGKEIWFNFDTRTDTAEVVAREMVKEFQFKESQFEVISKQIQNAILKREISPSAAQAAKAAEQGKPQNTTSKPPQAPAQQPSQQVGQTLSGQSAGAGQQEKVSPVPLLSNALSQGAQGKKSQASPSKISKDLSTVMFSRLLQDVEFFFTQMQNFGISDTEEIVEVMDCSADERLIRMNFINKVLMSKREYKQQLENHKQKQQKKAPPASPAQAPSKNPQPNQQPGAAETKAPAQSTSKAPILPPLVEPPRANDSNEVLNMTFSMPTAVKGNPPQTQVGPTSNQAKQLKLQSSPPTPAQPQNEGHYNQQAYASKKQSSFEANQVQAQLPTLSFTDKKGKESQKITFVVPQPIRDNFKASPQQFMCPLNLSKELKKIPHEDLLEKPDEEVIQLQHLLNLMWHDSMWQYAQKASSIQEGLDIIRNHIPLKIDGIFGIKTEKCVIKFQQFKGLPPTGVVSDFVWNMMLHHADQIVGEQLKHSVDPSIPVNPFAKLPVLQKPKSEMTNPQDQQQPLLKHGQSTSMQSIPAGQVSPNKLVKSVSTTHQVGSQPMSQSDPHHLHNGHVDYNYLMEKFFNNQPLPEGFDHQHKHQTGFQNAWNIQSNYPQYQSTYPDSPGVDQPEDAEHERDHADEVDPEEYDGSRAHSGEQ